MTQTLHTGPAPSPAFHSVGEVRQLVEDVQRWVNRGDYEQATLVERIIWEGVLESVAGANAQAGWIAAEALKTRDIIFPRWAA